MRIVNVKTGLKQRIDEVFGNNNETPAGTPGLELNSWSVQSAMISNVQRVVSSAAGDVNVSGRIMKGLQVFPSESDTSIRIEPGYGFTDDGHVITLKTAIDNYEIGTDDGDYYIYLKYITVQAKELASDDGFPAHEYGKSTRFNSEIAIEDIVYDEYGEVAGESLGSSGVPCSTMIKVDKDVFDRYYDVVYLATVTISSGVIDPVNGIVLSEDKGFDLGTSGYSGYSGTSGRSGHVGKSGLDGENISGYSGWSGYSGYSGYDGLPVAPQNSGWSGHPGPVGWSGTSGSHQAIGYTDLSTNNSAVSGISVSDAFNTIARGLGYIPPLKRALFVSYESIYYLDIYTEDRINYDVFNYDSNPGVAIDYPVKYINSEGRFAGNSITILISNEVYMYNGAPQREDDLKPLKIWIKGSSFGNVQLKVGQAIDFIYDGDYWRCTI